MSAIGRHKHSENFFFVMSARFAPVKSQFAICEVAGATGLEPAASGVTGRRSNQLSYAPFLGSRSLKLRAPASQEMGSPARDLSTPADKIEPRAIAKPCCC